jgi:hypothetical protein
LEEDGDKVGIGALEQWLRQLLPPPAGQKPPAPENPATPQAGQPLLQQVTPAAGEEIKLEEMPQAGDVMVQSTSEESSPNTEEKKDPADLYWVLSGALAAVGGPAFLSGLYHSRMSPSRERAQTD